MKKRKSRIGWDNMKVTFVMADPDPKKRNPQNPYSYMSKKQREEEIVKLAAKIWRRHCNTLLEKNLKA
ncbi:MAG: hypothetical protein KKH94_04200 [Candidatus Omnitrophica bacterium]|nr:hypothetical protein [Candidatus Omnitrophota bacterium]